MSKELDLGYRKRRCGFHANPKTSRGVFGEIFTGKND
jgi:hypothetical protein